MIVRGCSVWAGIWGPCPRGTAALALETSTPSKSDRCGFRLSLFEGATRLGALGFYNRARAVARWFCTCVPQVRHLLPGLGECLNLSIRVILRRVYFYIFIFVDWRMLEMAVKSLTKDGKVPVGLRMDPEDYEVLRLYAFEQNTTPNKAIIQAFFEFLDCKTSSGEGSR